MKPYSLLPNCSAFFSKTILIKHLKTANEKQNLTDINRKVYPDALGFMPDIAT